MLDIIIDTMIPSYYNLKGYHIEINPLDTYFKIEVKRGSYFDSIELKYNNSNFYTLEDILICIRDNTRFKILKELLEKEVLNNG